jgi:hypothetical protein
MVQIEGEYLDGFHIERIPQFSENQFDMNALSSIAGMRAVWLLYKLGRWDYLEDLGVDREQVEPALKQFRHYEERLTVRQAQQLKKKVPALVEASKELRTAYALKHLDRRKRMEMFIYHAETATSQQAKEAVKIHEPEIKAAGGSIEVGYGRSGTGGIVMVKLPASLDVQPENLLAGSGLKFSKVRAQVIQVPKGAQDLKRGQK